jgi:hypothetical protein
MAARYNYNQWSVVRNGLVTINYTTNVRDTPADVRRLQSNAMNISRGQFGSLNPDIGESYTVFNSDPKFDVNEDLTPDELFNAMTMNNIKQVLNTLRVTYDRRARKPQLVQVLSNAIRQQPNRLPYVRQIHTQHLATLRAGRQQGRRAADASLLVSNHYKYSKGDFEGMSKKNILRSLFDIDAHLSFLFTNVLKSKRIPKSKDMIIRELDTKIRNSGITEEAAIDSVYREQSIKSDRILKHNAEIVLDLLFASKNPFFINKKQYTVLGFHQENGPYQDPSQGLDLGANSIYVTYPIQLYIELTDKPIDKVTQSDLQKTSCHLRSEKIRKDWFDIWNTPEEGQPSERVFERKHRNPLTRRNINRGGKKRRTLRKKIKIEIL